MSSHSNARPGRAGRFLPTFLALIPAGAQPRPRRTPGLARAATWRTVGLAALTLGSAAASAESIVITGTRTPLRVDQALAQVTLIDRAQIEAAAGRTLVELLSGTPGVQVWSNGGPLKPASVSLRGLEARHTLLLIDGVRHGTATVGTPAWDNLPLDAIERIEIVHGPLSGLYGSDAVGGVIQIFTRRGREGVQPQLALGVGQRGYREAAAGIGFGQAGVQGSLRVQQRQADGFSATNERVPFGSHNPDPDGWRQRSASGALGTTLGPWRLQATVLAAQGQTRLDDGPGVDARAELRTRHLTASAEAPLAAGLRTRVLLGRAVDEYETLATASAFTPLGTIGTTQHQLSWENQLATPIGAALLLLDRVEQTVQRPGAPFSVSERRISGLGLGLNGESGSHGWQASVRRDRNSQFGSQTTGSVAWGVHLTPGLQAVVSAGRSFVAPSFNQLYFPGFGNPRLLPEEARQRELALVWRQGPVRSRVAWFEHRIRSYIPSGPLPANIPRVQVEGLSASLDAALGAWTVSASIDSVDPLNATAGSPNFGRVLPRRVQDSGRLALDWRGQGLSLGMTLLAFGERFENATNTLRMSGHATLDLRAEWQPARDWTLALRLNNALDQVYETVYGYNQPRREAYLTLRWAPR
jgi:vitamin B12 transporter